MRFYLYLVFIIVLVSQSGSAYAQITNAFESVDNPNADLSGTIITAYVNSTIYGTYYNNSINHFFKYDGKIFTTIFPTPDITNSWFDGISDNEFIAAYFNSSGEQYRIFNGSVISSFSKPNFATSIGIWGIWKNYIYGLYYDTSNQEHGFIYNGSYTSIDFPGGANTIITAVNSNAIAGTYVSNNQLYGFIKTGSTFTPIIITNANNSLVVGLSDLSCYGSFSDSSNSSHGFTYISNNYLSVDYPGCGPQGTKVINIIHNLTIGNYYDFSNILHAFSYDGSSFNALDVPNSYSTEIVSATDSYISGRYTDNLGFSHGFIMPSYVLNPLFSQFNSNGGYQAYLAANVDLFTNGITDQASSFTHWTNYGINENRPFDSGQLRSDLSGGAYDQNYAISGGWCWQYTNGSSTVFISADAPKPSGWAGDTLLLQKGATFNLGYAYNASQYAQLNPDVANAINSGQVPSFASVTDHYVKYGFKEGRISNLYWSGSQLWTQTQLNNWNDTLYLNSNPDVRGFFQNAHSRGWILYGKVGFAHFINFGRFENRQTGQ